MFRLLTRLRGLLRLGSGRHGAALALLPGGRTRLKGSWAVGSRSSSSSVMKTTWTSSGSAVATPGGFPSGLKVSRPRLCPWAFPVPTGRSRTPWRAGASSMGVPGLSVAKSRCSRILTCSSFSLASSLAFLAWRLRSMTRAKPQLSASAMSAARASLRACFGGLQEVVDLPALRGVVHFLVLGLVEDPEDVLEVDAALGGADLV